MTPLARTIITIGIILFTAGAISWILSGNWQWFAGGLAVFIGSLLAGGVLSVETKQTRTPPPPIPQQHHHSSTNTDLIDSDPWVRPDSPPPPTISPSPSPSPQINQPDDPFSR